MLICEDPKFIFIHIVKNAGSSITNALIPLCAGPWQQRLYYLMKKLRISGFGPRRYTDHIKAEELIEKIGREQWDDHFSFAFVRNPWDWQVSLYKYMLKCRPHPQHRMIKNMDGFREYVRWRCGPDAAVEYQKDYIYSEDGEQLVDFVGRFENLNDDFDRICARLGVDASLPRLNVSNTTPYQEFYDPETVELVRETYEPDISLFGYEFEPAPAEAS